ncbi:hypothetical protein DVH05_006821 [Phytophthora capsici]|nr:hypothetical protein DVH05_006821 [Phytophthora capsici]
MTARKGTTRPKRKASASSGPKRKRKVAAKDGKTPQEIARDILIKNGLLPTATREVRSTTPVKGKCGETLTREQRELIEERRRAALERRRFPSSSPGMLTKEQRERIEKRRQEALKKRRQTLQSAGANNARPTVADLATDAGSNRQQSRSWIEPSPAVQQRSRVVTPDNLPTANLAAEVDRSEFFWDDLEAAAEIVQWENEHMAKVALVRPPANTYNQELNTTEYGRGQQIQQGRQRPAISTIPSLSQELAAAAEIIEWEKKHEDSPEKSGIRAFNESICGESEAQAPQFQLLPVHITENHESKPNLQSKPKLTSHCKRKEPSPGQRYCLCFIILALQH